MGKIVYVGEIVYSTSLSMVKVKYSANVRKIVADFLHVPSNGYSSRRIDMKQYSSSSICVVGFFFYLSDSHLVFYIYFFFYEATSQFQNLLKIQMLVWGEADSKTSPKRSL
ncbi:hypothetical protein Tco_0900337 [Tanacetum coccineum]